MEMFSRRYSILINVYTSQVYDKVLLRSLVLPEL
jgi:hypothetical protein